MSRAVAFALSFEGNRRSQKNIMATVRVTIGGDSYIECIGEKEIRVQIIKLYTLIRHTKLV